MQLTTHRTSAFLAAVALGTLLAAPVTAHDAPDSTTFVMPVPPETMTGSILSILLIGPPDGSEVIHTTWDLSFHSPPGGTPASDVVVELTLPLDSGAASWAVTGAELGWPNATGTHHATLGSDLLNGTLLGGLGGSSWGDLDIFAMSGGVTGVFLGSTIALELAADTTCQTDLGFGGPGALSLAVCGDALGAGGEATLRLEGATGAGTAFLALSTTATPTPFKGGTLVPLPLLLVLDMPVAADGTAALTVPGGGGPLDVIVQAAMVDGAQPAGFALSNAVQVELLP